MATYATATVLIFAACSSGLRCCFEVADEEIQELGVKLRPAPMPEDFEGFRLRIRSFIRFLAAEGVVHINDSDNPSLEWDRVADQPMRVAVSVESLVMGQGHDRPHTADRGVSSLEHFESGLGMTLHDHPLFFRQEPRLQEDCLRYADLAHIVKLARNAKRLDLVGCQAGQNCKTSGTRADAVQMRCRLGVTPFGHEGSAPCRLFSGRRPCAILLVEEVKEVAHFGDTTRDVSFRS